MIPIPQDIVRHSLRTDLPWFAVATILVFAGVSAIVLARFPFRNALLLWSGLFLFLLGVRLFLSNELLQFATGIDHRFFVRGQGILTFLLPIPYAGFFRALLGPGWKDSLTVWLWVEIAFAPAAIALDFLTAQLGAAYVANAVLMLIATLLAVANAIRRLHSRSH